MCISGGGEGALFFLADFGSLFPSFASFSLSSGVFGPSLAKLGCLIRFLSLMVSVFKLMGRGRPCNFKNKPQALQRTWPVSSRRQSGVVCVLQLRHTGDEMLLFVVVVPLLICVVVLALGCTGFASTIAGKRCISLMGKCGLILSIELQWVGLISLWDSCV